MKSSVFSKFVLAAVIFAAVCASSLTASAVEKGNLNGNGCIWLEDAIVGLRILAGLPATGLVNPYTDSGADVNGDNKAGLEEVIYVLQKVAGLRFALYSHPSFVCGTAIPLKYVYNLQGQCAGQNISPQLSWSNAPAGTQSFVLIMDDPDAGNFVHWIVYDIPASATSLAENAGVLNSIALPLGAKQGMSDWLSNSYGGPCAPAGTGIHRYFFRLYALNKASLNLDPSAATKAAVNTAMEGSVIDIGIVMGTYVSP